MKIQFEDLIIFEDDDFVVVNKPANLSTLDERTREKSVSLLRMGKHYYRDIQAAHRLDKGTSGALAFAKNPSAYRHLAMQFENRDVIKRYHAVSQGVHVFESISVYLPISPLTHKTAVKIDREKGKNAETIFNTLIAYRSNTLVECIPITGRMHQIRIHLACLKAPIINDEQYGGAPLYLSDIKRKVNIKKDATEQPLIQRVALHAHSLGFAVMNGEFVRVEAPYPKDFDVLVKLLGKYNQ